MIPILLKDIFPCQKLQEYVRKYQVFRFIFDKQTIPPAKFHVPKPEHSVTFYIRDTQKFSNVNSKEVFTYPQCVINGMYTGPVHRYGGNDFLAIKVVLQPSTLYKLVKFPIKDLTDNFLNAEDIWGAKIRLTCDRLKELNELDKMLLVIEEFFIELVNKTTMDSHPIDNVTNYMLNSQNNASLDWLASQSCLSKRQFIRKFEERIGVNAKRFERIIRFDKAYRMKNSHPEYDWPYIAIDCNYHDYQHMVKDFKEFTGFAPPSFYNVEMQSPERRFGLIYEN